MKQTLSAALSARGYTNLTAVQEAVTEPGLEGADLLVSAQTGSGKTVSFGLAIAPTLLGEAESFGYAGAPLALVIAPTRELALQVRHELTWLYKETGAVLASCVGGMDARAERRALERGAHIVVATPGRLCDHLRRGAIDLSQLRAVVLDEADEMLDLGFRDDLETILEASPESRQTLLFSATVSPEIARLAKRYQRDAQRISTQSGTSQHTDIDYRAVMVADHDEENAITNLLRFHEPPNAIVFANTRAAVARLVTRLTNRGFAVVSLSGELTQSERSHALQAMRDGRARICVATDVAARGIDLPNLDLVIHAELPQSEEALLHRSGRTGRAGRKGISALIVPPRARNRAERMLRAAKVTAEWEPGPSAEAVLARDEARLLADPVWAEPAAETETATLAALLAQRSPEQLALAMMRLWRGQRSAPEELESIAPRVAPGAGFGPSRWFSIPIGRISKASPKWLMPKVCEAGGITRNEIGAIRIFDDESFVEVSANVLDHFLEALGPTGEIAPGLRLTLLEGVPEEVRNAGTGRPGAGRKPGFKPKFGGKPGKSFGGKSFGEKSYGDKPHGDKPAPKGPRKPRPEGDFSERPTKPAYKGDRADKPSGDKFAKPARKGGWEPRDGAKPKAKYAPKGPAKAGKPYKGKKG
ncbi:DEAD/DEAH box helicase [Pseudothioclava arenosa]|uniref:ATP-dependent RNA helicase n=1 Tax=Pseudothioclava arenosa TaxID=1795308 RepID=A0A2A4CRB6_9RHOB|nr:DEAD/DEAH box helicase [Pseudothioclava arenosa]PCD77135.1 ATP-dependent RNA helicase [Pseudothioclava arenosa]